MEAGKYYTVPLNVTVLENNDATYEEIQQEPEEETANCYIVTETGEHDFKATVIGNGQKGIIPGAGFHTETAEIDPKSAKLLWTDVENFVSDVRLEADGRVHYQVNSLSGNAVIAVYSEADQQGDILWSWHIWGTGGEMPGDEVITNRVDGEFVMMDRTLGAHSKTSTSATLYQWGRKDPFPNSETYYVDGEAIDISDDFNSIYETSTGTILESIQHPASYIRYKTTSYQNNWLAEDNGALWGDSYEYHPTSFLDPNAVSGWAYGKTIYDPSPVGYRVSGKFAWTGFVNNSSSLYASRDRNINYVRYDNGYYFEKNGNDTEGTFYPMIGSRGSFGGVNGGINDDGTYLVGYNAGYWKSDPCSPTSGGGRSYMMEIGVRTEPSGNDSNPDNTVRASYLSERKNAFGIRCEKEK